MTQEQPQDREPGYQTPLWSAVISGSILLVGTSIWTWVQSALKTIPAGWITLIVGLLALAALIAFVKPVRRWTRELARYVWSMRLITRRRADHLAKQEAGHQAHEVAMAGQDLIKTQDEVIEKQKAHLLTATQIISANERAIVSLEQARDLAEEQRDKADHNAFLFQTEAESMKRETSHLKVRLSDLVATEQQIRKLQSTVTALDKRATDAETDLKSMREVAPWPDEPLPQPRWRVIMPWDDPTEPLRLANLVPGSVTKQVRIESDDDYYRINDAGYWDVIEGGESKPFDGLLTKIGRQHGATIWVYWVDENGENRQDQQKIDAVEDPPAISFDAWSSS